MVSVHVNIFAENPQTSHMFQDLEKWSLEAEEDLRTRFGPEGKVIFEDDHVQEEPENIDSGFDTLAWPNGEDNDELSSSHRLVDYSSSPPPEEHGTIDGVHEVTRTHRAAEDKESGKKLGKRRRQQTPIESEDEGRAQKAYETEDEDQPREEEEGLGDDKAEDAENDNPKKPGRLSRRVKEELDAAQAEYEAKVASIAAGANKNVHACWRYLNETIFVSRETNPWNAFQSWYGVHGDYQRPKSMEPAEWTAFVAKKYQDIVDSKLRPEDRHNKDLKCDLFAEQIKWFEEHHDAYVDKKKVEGKFQGTVKSMLKPVFALGKHLYRNTGAHLLGHLVLTDRDAQRKSRSVTWGCTDVVKQVIEEHAVDLRTQLTDIETLLRGKEMKMRGISKELAKLSTACLKTQTDSGPRDRDRRVISASFVYDVDRCIGIKTIKLTPGQFVMHAYKFHVRVINWPVGLPFFNTGLGDLHSMSAIDIKKIAGPRIAQISREVNGEEDDEVEKCFEVVKWNDDEIELWLEDQAKIPIVLDTEGKAVVTVSYSSCYKDELEERAANDIDNDNDVFYEDDEVSKDNCLTVHRAKPNHVSDVSHASKPRSTNQTISQIEERLIRRSSPEEAPRTAFPHPSRPHHHTSQSAARSSVPPGPVPRSRTLGPVPRSRTLGNQLRSDSNRQQGARSHVNSDSVLHPGPSSSSTQLHRSTQSGAPSHHLTTESGSRYRPLLGPLASTQSYPHHQSPSAASSSVLAKSQSQFCDVTQQPPRRLQGPQPAPRFDHHAQPEHDLAGQHIRRQTPLLDSRSQPVPQANPHTQSQPRSRPRPQPQLHPHRSQLESIPEVQHQHNLGNNLKRKGYDDRDRAEEDQGGRVQFKKRNTSRQ
ncbi:hypothetical protein F5880DRAFT_1618849 [Lentinula raphanica]|nr:hypothetical protein F5880DRAFT_1618849 [Lentinula raphanica]